MGENNKQAVGLMGVGQCSCVRRSTVKVNIAAVGLLNAGTPKQERPLFVQAPKAHTQ